MKKLSLGIVLLLAAPAFVHADDAALAKCRAIAEAGARLACYDAIPLAAAVATPQAAPPAPAVAGATGTAIPAPVAKVSGASYEASLTATPPPPPTPAPAAKVTAKAYSASVAATPAPVEERAQPSSAKQAEQFGVENVRPKEQLDKIESSIAGPFEGWVPHQRIRLANGQVWQIADDSTHWMSVENPKVVIWRGLLGAYYMNIGTLNQAPRVERVK